MKPIHKFNGGIGATLCNECSKIISEGMTDDLFCDEHGGKTFKYTLIRERDGLTIGANKITWIEWSGNGTGKAMHEDPAIDRSLMLEPSISYKWMTTTITEIVEQSEGYIKFKTLNSIYELKYEHNR
jgi:hypothetical protein